MRKLLIGLAAIVVLVCGVAGTYLYHLFEERDLAPKFYPVLSSLQRFLVAVVGSVAAGCGAEPFRLRSTASR
ncbi:hypothetical protein, partial [Rhizobium redzepovicii]|uniref:hypothetical protein n=1 Tax=Rhizobium redzepovicii TaxID=2867518 RepID=UPI001C92BE98